MTKLVKVTGVLTLTVLFAMAYVVLAPTPVHAEEGEQWLISSNEVSDARLSGEAEKMMKNEKKAAEYLKKAKANDRKAASNAKKSVKAAKAGNVKRASVYLKKAKKFQARNKAIYKKCCKIPGQKAYAAKIKNRYLKTVKRVRTAKDAIAEAKRLIANQNRYSEMADKLRWMGVINHGGWRYTWYSQKVLPGGGLNIPGRHVGLADMVMDGAGRVCVACSSLPYGTVIDTPFGEAKVYDSGCPYGTIDVYTNW